MAPARTPVSGPRQTGTIIEWKGSFGWIEPSKEIKHPSASKKGGRVYLFAEDVAEELDGVGAVVSFCLYSDKSGLGAADCKMAKGGASGKQQTSNAVAHHKAGKGKGKDKGRNEVQKPAFEKSHQGNDKSGRKGKGKGKGKGKDAGPREILHEEPLIGTIASWKGKFGWITPHDTIEHPMADAHQGDLFCVADDIEEEIEGEGAEVQFILYGDRKGLGAQNVRPA